MRFWNSLQIILSSMCRERAARQGIGDTTYSGNACLLLVRTAVVVLFVLLPVVAFAEAIPRGGPNDSRVRLATYQEGQVYRLNVSLTHVTTIEFGEGESIRPIIAGDTEGFEI